MKSISSTDKSHLIKLEEEKAKVSIEIYHHTDAAMRAITDDDLQNNANAEDTSKQYVSMDIRVDKEVHEWLAKQGANSHLTVNEILASAMKQDKG